MQSSSRETAKDLERKRRIQKDLRQAGFAAVVCALPSNVLLHSGYWPVVGASIAIVICDGPTILLVPKDEEELAQAGFADAIETFIPDKLNEAKTISDAIKPRLADLFRRQKLRGEAVGVECDESSEAASYLAIHLYGDNLPRMVADLFPKSRLVSINEWAANAKCVKTPIEIDKIRQACGIAKNAFEIASAKLHPGIREPEAAALFRGPLSDMETFPSSVQRCDGFAFCMSGPNSATACAAYARTRQRMLEPADLVMIHCNSYVDGFWTDITRTYTLASPTERQTRMRAAVLEARKSALAAIKPGVRAADVDSAARQVLCDFGLGEYIKHGTGHGVGFTPMSAYGFPRLQVDSPDVLQEGMVFNVEPAVYIEEHGGMRHCDMVAVTGSGHEVLTDFQSDPASLAITKPEIVRDETARLAAGS
ncbi:MAG: Xaa-Pro peptidase family protein [Candidatus Acidiferrales bacterium]